MQENFNEWKKQIEDEPDVDHLDVGGFRKVIEHADEDGGGGEHGLGAYISNLIFVLKPWVQAGRFEYHKPYKWNKIEIWIIRGLQIFKGI